MLKSYTYKRKDSLMEHIDHLKIMLEKQTKLNILTAGEDWKEQNLNFRRECFLEGAELINSMNHKWWKSEEMDIPNARLEAIDMLHFALSIYLVDFGNSTESMRDKLLALQEPEATEIDNETVIVNAEQVILGCLDASDAADILGRIGRLCLSLGMDLYFTLKLYLGKGVLNKFRQEHGYKDGSYIKMWDDGSTEDNVFMMESLDTVDLDEDFEDVLYEHLEIAYTGHN